MKAFFYSAPQGLGFRLLALAAATLLATGCPAGKPNSDSGDATNRPPNSVVIHGSNTIGEELAPRLIAEFTKQYPVVKFDLQSKATGYGMAALRIGQCDLAAASRAAVMAELELAKEVSLEMNEYRIGTYSVGVVVHAQNPIADLSTNQVRDIFSGKIQNWKEVGGPDAPIHLYVRDPISGTHLGFKDVALGNEEYALHPKLLTSYPALRDAVAADPNGIGYSGYLAQPDERIKQLTIGGVDHSAAGVNSGKYPYTRGLRFYTNKAHEKAAAKKFLEFVLSPRGQEILMQAGFAPKP